MIISRVEGDVRRDRTSTILVRKEESRRRKEMRIKRVEGGGIVECKQERKDD